MEPRRSAESIDALPPAERTRYELGVEIARAVERTTLTAVQGKALRRQLVVGGHSSRRFDSNRVFIETLDGINEIIDQRKSELQGGKKFPEKQLAYHGMLGLVIGDASTDRLPMSRIELASVPMVEALAQANPRIDRNVFVDKAVQFDIQWLAAMIFDPNSPRIRKA